MRNTLVCTVGTSLFSNLTFLNEKTNDKPLNWKLIKEHFMQERWAMLAEELYKTNSPDIRLLGAEINTIEEAKKKNWLAIQNLIFLVSDTEKGENTGKVLTKYFEKRKDLNLVNIEYIKIEKLQDQNPKEFKTTGLRNLVRVVGDIIQRFGAEQIAIDATGGYKAQIAVAVLIGQALKIPVYYKHELFSEIIDFPALPISLDYDILGKNASLLSDFEKGYVFSSSEISKLDDKIKVFLDEIEEGGESIYELNAIGQLYLTSFRLRYPKATRLKPLSQSERKKPTFGNDHHYPKGFKNFVQKVWEENNWIKTCWTIPYGGQGNIKGIGFNVRQEKEKNILVGHFKTDDFGARFQLELSDNSIESLIWVADYLNMKYKK